MRHLALLSFWNKDLAKETLTKLDIPEWATITRWATQGMFADSLVIEFSSSDPNHFYATPSNCEPPHLRLNDDGTVDWESLDGTGTGIKEPRWDL